MMQRRLQRLLIGRMQLGMAGFVALCIAVACNIFYLQPIPTQRTMRLELHPSPTNANVRPHEAAPIANGVVASDAVTATRALQRELESRGYLAGINDGVAGLVTRAAIMAYEYDHGLPLTGEPTEALLKTVILGSAGADAQTPPVTARAGPLAEGVIRTTQQSLTSLGFGPIKADGVMDTTTVAAIRRFEHQQGLPETGRISSVVVARLVKLASLGQAQTGR